MKKLLLSILTFLYMMVTSGFAMEVHYCMGKKAGVDFYRSENSKCGRCGMKNKKNACCNDDYKFYKLADAHKNINNDITTGFNSPALVPGYNLYSLAAWANVAITHPANHSPPDVSAIPLFIRNCVFRL